MLTQIAQKRAWCRSRNIRIAYLVERSEDSHAILDAIFEHSFSLWGGRFSLIVPCKQGVPEVSYREWLRKFDADVIYSYVDLEQAVFEDLHEDLYPSFLVRHASFDKSDDCRRFRPELPVGPLSAITTVPLWASSDRTGQQRKLTLVNGWWSHEDRFLLDSFGYFRSVFGTVPAALEPFCRLLTVLPADEVKGKSHYPQESEQLVHSTIELLDAMTRDWSTRSMSQMSSAFSDQLAFDDRGFASGLNLVVGDSFEDRLFYWNSRHLFPRWRDGQIVDLRVPKACAESAEFLKSLGQFFNKRNEVTVQNGNYPAVFVRSASLPHDFLQEVVGQLKADQSWVFYKAESLQSAEVYLPDAKQLECSRLSSSFRSLTNPAPWWRETAFNGDSLRLAPPSPEHLRFVPPALHSPNFGAWAVDLEIERNIDHQGFDNVAATWRLPRRLRVTSAFLRSYQITAPAGAYMEPRVSYGGNLTVYSTGGVVSLPEIRLPSDKDAVIIGLLRGRDWRPFKRHDDGLPRQLCSHAKRSNNGNYFWGVFQLFGSIGAAHDILGHSFWREHLIALGASEERNPARIGRLQSKLQKDFGQKTFDGKNPDHLERLAGIVLKVADELRAGVQSVNWSDLRAKHLRLLEVYRTANPRNWALEDDEAIRLDEEASLEESLKELCAKGIMLQGYQRKCRNCHDRSWLPIGALSPVLTCAICGQRDPAPIDVTWEFRLNDFLRDALRLHGIWPLFWVLSKTKPRMPASFWFEGPLDIYFERSHATDIDLTIVTDGRVRMCEVKESARQMKDPERFAETITQLRPDVGTIAIMEPRSKKIESLFQRFEQSLAGTGIAAELITLEEGDFEDWPLLI